MNVRKNISFMFPVTSGLMGGVQSLIISYINELSKNELINVRLYDYTNGLIYEKLDDSVKENIQFIPLDSNDWSINNLGNEVFVLTDFLWQKYPFFFKNRNDVKILMLDVFYPNWKTFNKGGRIPLYKLREKSIEILTKNKAVAFIEEEGHKAFTSIGGTIDKLPSIVPIPFDFSSNQKKTNVKQKNEIITIGYVGRAVDWKIEPVKKLMDDLGRIQGKSFNIVIYTDDVTLFNNKIKRYDNQKVEFISGLAGVELKDSIMEKIDIGYSMGTSSLEFASISIPTILADFSNNEFPSNYKYRWLFQANLGNVGKDVNDIDPLEERCELHAMLQSDFSSIGNKCYTYAYNTHNIDGVILKLLFCCDNTTLTLKKSRHLVIYQQLMLYIVKRFIRRNEKFYGWGIK